MVYSIIIYLTIMFMCMWFTHWSQKHKTEIGNILAFSLLFFLLVLRYDIGYDYSKYVYTINMRISNYNMQNIRFNAESLIEPLFTFLTYIFRDFKYAYIPVITTYTLIWTIFIYKTFQNYNIHTFGIFLVFIIGFVFVEMDQIRQGCAIAVFLYSIRFIKEKRFDKYLLYILFAASIHFSAILLIIVYFTGKLKPNKLVYTTIIILFLFLFNASKSIQLYEYLVTNYLSIYTLRGYETSTALEQFSSISYKIRIVFYCIVWIFVIYKLPENENALINILFIGALIFILASGAMNIRRMSNYFTFSTIISIPLVYQIKKHRLILLLLVFGLFLFYVRDSIVGLHQGCIPYKSILFQDLTLY